MRDFLNDSLSTSNLEAVCQPILFNYIHYYTYISNEELFHLEIVKNSLTPFVIVSLKSFQETLYFFKA